MKKIYLYTLSQKGEIIDRLILFTIEGETKQGNNVGDTFNIDKNYKINNSGKFIEIKK